MLGRILLSRLPFVARPAPSTRQDELAHWRIDLERTGFVVLSVLLVSAILTARDVPGDLGWAAGRTERVAVLLYLGAVSADLIRYDITVRRLPNVLVVPGFVLAACSGAVWGFCPPAWGIAGAVFGAAALVASGGGLGGGDVKLLALITVGVGSHGPGAVAVTLGSGLVLGGAMAAIVLVKHGVWVKHSGAKSDIALGPALLMGFWITAVLSAS